jgi:osmotically inducible lipoprotein OsmB
MEAIMMKHVLAAGALLALAACGTTTEDRALSGGGIGAGAGLLGGAAVGHPVEGALLGGAGGAAAGGLTKPSDVDLGKPVWRR